MKGHEEQCRDCKHAKEFIGDDLVDCTYNNSGITNYEEHEHCAAQWGRDPKPYLKDKK